MNGLDNLRLALHPRVLELIIFPTEKCNFRCTYCYEDFELGKMKRPVIEGIKNLINARIERNTLEALTLSWFGGEPTLAADVVLELSGYGRSLLEAGRLRQFSGGLTTNGYLLRETLLRQLVACRQTSYQISLDGYGDGHDQTRKYASGKGTFDVIWANLLAAQKTDLQFEILLRLHQTDSNGDSMQQLVDAIEQNFSGDTRFSVFFKSIENLGGANAASIKKVDVDRVGTRVRKLSAQLRERGFRVTAVLDGPESSRGDSDDVPDAVNDSSFGPPSGNETLAPKGYGGYICYAAKPNSLIIRSDGRVGKCTVMLNDDRNMVGRLHPDGSLSLDDARLKLWMRGFSSFDPIEMGCPAQTLPALPLAANHEVPLLKLSDLRASVAP